jgi:hypothetical protein
MTTAYTTTRHRCDHCRRSYANATTARRHEAECWRNPASHACPTCVHFQPSAFVDCSLGLGSYSQPQHWEDDPKFEWERDCFQWSDRSVEPCPTARLLHPDQTVNDTWTKP